MNASEQDDADEAESGEERELRYRLPTTASPRRYHLHLSPDLDERRFSGTEVIELDVHEPTRRIVLNAVDLAISDARLAANGDDTKTVALTIESDEANEEVAFVADEPIEVGGYRLSCAFSGILNDRLRGFYRSTFIDEEGTERTIATTQFEETDARRAFPCFDEPEAKAVFSITLDAPPGTIALSNAAEDASEQLEGGGTRTHFRDTVTMSSYLVCFIVGPLELTGPVEVDGIELRIAHVPGRGHLTGPAFDAAAHALRFFGEYFDIAYPGDKLDLVALPDFASGAMENLGCVTFREAILLADPERASRVELERLSEVVEHEIAHMWFGDLVTMRWWNGIWLNEAFATFMALCCQDDYRPDWDVFVGFARERASALGIDGLHTTRPVEYPVHAPEDAAAMFDVLTYEKGASVLWMLERFIGRKRFRAGVRRYLKAHAYANTETSDLWDAIGAEASDVPIRALMESWIFQGGYPLVHAEVVLAPGGEEAVVLRQTPFSYLPMDASPSKSAIGDAWLVPVLARPARSEAAGQDADATGAQRLLLGDAPERLAAAAGPLVLNAGGTGYYRLFYDQTLRAGLLAELESLDALERCTLVGDTWATVVAGLEGLDAFFAILSRLSSETNPHVWSITLSALGLIDLVAPEELRPALAATVASTLQPQLERIGWSPVAGEDEATPLLRSAIVASLGTIAHDEAVIAKARELFAAERENPTALDPDLASAVLAVVAAHAREDDFVYLLERYRQPRDPMDEIRHLSALGHLTDEGFASTVRELTLNEIRSQNAPYLLAQMLSNRAIGLQTWDYITKHYDAMIARFPDNSIQRMLEGVAALAQLGPDGAPLCATRVTDFCDEHVSGRHTRAVHQSLERLEVNVRLATRVRIELGRLLELR